MWRRRSLNFYLKTAPPKYIPSATTRETRARSLAHVRGWLARGLEFRSRVSIGAGSRRMSHAFSLRGDDGGFGARRRLNYASPEKTKTQLGYPGDRRASCSFVPRILSSWIAFFFFFLSFPSAKDILKFYTGEVWKRELKVSRELIMRATGLTRFFFHPTRPARFLFFTAHMYNK